MELRNLPGLSKSVCAECHREHGRGECSNQNNPHAYFAMKTNPNEPLVWERMTKGQKFWTITGKVFAFIMAIGCGVQTAAAFMALPLMAAGIASFLVAGLIFMAGAAINWYIFKKAVPDVLNDLFGKEGWFQGLFELEAHCDLVKSEKDPLNTPLAELPLVSETAYLRHGDKLYYINTASKSQPVIEVPNMNAPQISIFDKSLYVEDLKDEQAKKLTRNALNKITAITGHSQVSRLQSVLMALGVTLALSVGITFGALTYASTFSLTSAFGFLAAISPAFPPIAALLAVVTLVCLTALMLKDIAKLIKNENIFDSCKKFIVNLFDFSPRCELKLSNVAPSASKLASLNLSTNAAYIKVEDALKVQDDLYYVNQENKECYKITNVKASQLYDPAQWEQKDGQKLSHEEVSGITSLTKQTPKGVFRTVAERLFTTILTIAFIPLAMLGLFMTQNACVSGVKSILQNLLPKVSSIAIGVVAGITSLGLAFLGQIPFILSTTTNTIASFFSKEIETADHLKESEDAKKALKDKDLAQKHTNASQAFMNRLSSGLKTTGLYTLAFINAIGNGLISAVGGAFTLFIQVLSGVGGFWNSFAAGFDAVRSSLSAKSQIMKTLYEQQESNRSWRLFGLVASAIIFTPLSLAFTLPFWKKAEDEDNTIERVEIPTLEYELLREKRTNLLVAAELEGIGGANTLNKPVAENEKLPKLVVDSADFKTKILYVDKHSADRLRFFASFDEKALNERHVQTLNDSVEQSLRFVSPPAA